MLTAVEVAVSNAKTLSSNDVDIVANKPIQTTSTKCQSYDTTMAPVAWDGVKLEILVPIRGATAAISLRKMMTSSGSVNAALESLQLLSASSSTTEIDVHFGDAVKELGFSYTILHRSLHLPWSIQFRVRMRSALGGVVCLHCSHEARVLPRAIHLNLAGFAATGTPGTGNDEL